MLGIAPSPDVQVLELLCVSISGQVDFSRMEKNAVQLQVSQRKGLQGRSPGCGVSPIEKPARVVVYCPQKILTSG